MKSLLHPTVFPNIATMAVVAQQEVVWEVHDNFQKQTHRNRYHICTDQGLHKLSIPIQHVGGKDGRQKYDAVQIDNSYPWQLQQWRTLQTAYRTSPFFEFYEDELQPLFQKKYTHLLDFNWDTIAFLTDALQIPTPPNKTESYQKTISQGYDGRFLVNAKKPAPYTLGSYNQVFGDRHSFIPNTSSLDLLFNEGPNAIAYLKSIALV